VGRLRHYAVTGDLAAAMAQAKQAAMRISVMTGMRKKYLKEMIARAT
jgi:hypothetical protein